MKKNLLALGLMFACVSLSAHADWRCNVHNARGQGWSIRGVTHDIAVNNAMRVCIRNSRYARNCQVTNCYRY